MKSPNWIHKFNCNNKGSAVVTVIVSMLFVIALGFSLLFASYTGYRVKIAERADRSNFYTAETAMDTIRANLQTAVSDAVAAAYTETLPKFNTITDHQKALNAEFERNLFASVIPASSGGTKLFNSQKAYNLAALKLLVPSTGDTTILVTSGGSLSAVTGTVVEKIEDDKVVSISLVGVSVKVTHKGYESNVTSDICIKMPEFFVNPVALTNVSNYSIVANKGIVSGGLDSKITGTFYVGEDGITVPIGNALSLSDGNVYCKGDVKVDGTLNLKAPNKEFWAKSLAVDSTTNGVLTLNSNMYVADDLVINGTGSKVSLSGTYFGFGNSATTSKESSAIIVNGKKAALSLAGLDRLSLAGVSFIDVLGSSNPGTPSNLPKTSLPMGESVTVKSNQLAYLVPPDCISNYPSNPCAFNSSPVPAPIYSLNAPLWRIGNVEKTLADYLGAGGSKGSIKTLYKPLGGEGSPTIAYVFIEFKTQAAASEYFKDYFAAFPDRIGDYLKLYVSLGDLLPATTSSAGNTFYLKDNKLVLKPATGPITSGATQEKFKSIKPPYDTFVNTDELSKLQGQHIFSLDGKDVAIVSNGTVNYSNNASEIQLIIAGGDVTVTAPFNGIIFAGGTITVNNAITSTPLLSGISSATAEINGVSRTLSEFLIDSALTDTVLTEDPWSANNLVTYENWKKH